MKFYGSTLEFCNIYIQERVGKKNREKISYNRLRTHHRVTLTFYIVIKLSNLVLSVYYLY